VRERERLPAAADRQVQTHRPRGRPARPGGADGEHGRDVTLASRPRGQERRQDHRREVSCSHVGTSYAGCAIIDGCEPVVSIRDTRSAYPRATPT
jgi:hypothetical protein